MLCVKLNHFFKPIARPINNAPKRDRSPQREHVNIGQIVARVVRLARDVADAVNHAAKSDTVKRLAQRLGATDLEDVVGAVAVCEFHDFLFPVWVAAVVDDVVGTELLGAGELLVRRRSHNG